MSRGQRAVQLVAIGGLVLAGAAGGRAIVRISIQESRERWNILPPDEREELVDRYAQFQDLPVEERRELLRRNERLSEVERELLESFAEPERKKFDGLDGPKRRRILRELLVTELLDRGFRARQELSPDLLLFLESVPPADRAFAVREIERQSFAHRTRILGERLGKPRSEMIALEELSLEAVEQSFHEIQREYVSYKIQRDGLPTWLSGSEWEKIQRTTDEEFPRVWKRVLRRRSTEFPTEPQEQGAPEPPLRELREALRPDPAWYLDLADLPAEERDRRFARRIRERIVGPLAKLGIDPAELELEGLADLSGIELNETLRERVSQILLDREVQELRADQAADF